DDLHENRLGQLAEGGRGRLEGVLAKNVANTNTQQLFILETVQDWLKVRRAAAQVGQLLTQLVGGAGLVEHQAIEQLVDHAGIVDENLGEKLTPGTKIDVQLQARWIEAEQLPQYRLGPQGRRHFFQIGQGHVRIGSLRERP